MNNMFSFFSQRLSVCSCIPTNHTTKRPMIHLPKISCIIIEAASESPRLSNLFLDNYKLLVKQCNTRGG